MSIKIEPYMVRFRVDPVTGFGIPTDDVKKVELFEQNYYAIQTHDKKTDNTGRPIAFYQIAFKLVEYVPYQPHDIVLAIDQGQQKGVDAIPDNLVSHEDDSGIWWYQPSQYIWDSKKEQWKLTDKYQVDSITTAGLFRVVVYLRRTKVIIQRLPLVYVLPSSVTPTDYSHMIHDLFNVHTSLLNSKTSTVGYGDSYYQWNIDQLKRLYETIKLIIKKPSELLQKGYAKQPFIKVKRFDARTMKSYVQNGDGSRIMSLSYGESYDIYENRIIKCAIKAIVSEIKEFLSNSSVPMPQSALSHEESGQNVDNEGEGETALAFCRNGIDYSEERPPRITVDYSQYWQRISIKTNGHNWLTQTEKLPDYCNDDICNLEYRTRSFKKALMFLSYLCKCYSDNNARLSIQCNVKHEREIGENGKDRIYKSHHISQFVLTNIKHLKLTYMKQTEQNNGARIQPKQCCFRDLKSIQEDQYFSQLEKMGTKAIDEKHEFTIEILDKRYNDYKINKEKNAQLEHWNGINVQREKLKGIQQKLQELLMHPWFEGITSVANTELACILQTPKFLLDKHYKSFFISFRNLIEHHPIISRNLNDFAMGLLSSEKIYEHWVFYKILAHLSELGFTLKNSEKALEQEFADFINIGGIAKRQQHLGFIVNMQHSVLKNMTLDVGIDCVIKSEEDSLSPDIFLRINHGDDEFSWYFMDAKYKTFSSNGTSEFSYIHEIHEVSIWKYIQRMNSILASNEATINYRILNEHKVGNKKKETVLSGKHHICGSYIIGANIANEPCRDLAINGRLFGTKDHLHHEKKRDFSKEYKNESKIKYMEQQYECMENNFFNNKSNPSKPNHRYGVIQLTPQNSEQLRTLFMMIFEYSETGYKEHDNFQICWKCGYPHVASRQEKISKKSYKYWDTCMRQADGKGHCEAFRVRNHCANCGNILIKCYNNNYHSRCISQTDPYKPGYWYYWCPKCGDGDKTDNQL